MERPSFGRFKFLNGHNERFEKNPVTVTSALYPGPSLYRIPEHRNLGILDKIHRFIGTLVLLVISSVVHVTLDCLKALGLRAEMKKLKKSRQELN